MIYIGPLKLLLTGRSALAHWPFVSSSVCILNPSRLAYEHVTKIRPSSIYLRTRTFGWFLIFPPVCNLIWSLACASFMMIQRAFRIVLSPWHNLASLLDAWSYRNKAVLHFWRQLVASSYSWGATRAKYTILDDKSRQCWVHCKQHKCSA